MALRRRLLWLVVFALVGAQALGFMHRVAHSGHTSAATALSTLDAREAHESDPAAGWISELFGGHDVAGCQVYDQLSHGGCVPTMPTIGLPLVLSSFVLAWYPGEVLARWAALFQARAPPSIR